MKRLRVGLIALGLIASGCANPKAANPENFTIALNGYFQSRHGACTKTPSYPLQLTDPQGYTPGFAASWTLNKLGLLTLKVTTHTDTYGFFSEQHHIYSYAPSAKAKPFWQASSSEFCFAGLHVNKIENFTEPVASSEVGAVMTQVKYSYYLDNVAPWAKNQYARKFLPGVNDYLSGDRQTIAMQRLVLTDKGWQVWNASDAGAPAAPQ